MLDLHLNSIKFKSILLLLWITCSISLNAQDNKTAIQEIQTHYYALKAKMKASTEAEYPTYYVLRIEENVDRKLMPAVGNYYGTDEFWYRPNEKTGADGREGVLMYRKNEFKIAARTEWTEYVFKNGKLVFCFIKIDGGGEHRYYFKNDILIKYLEKDVIGNFYSKEDAKYLLNSAKG